MAGFIDTLDSYFKWMITGKKPEKKPQQLPYDAVYFHKLCVALRDSAKDRPRIMLDAKLDEDNSFLECKVHAYTDKNKHVACTISEESKEDLRRSLIALRDHIVEKNGAYWLGLKLNLDVPADKYTIDFLYK